MRAVLRTPARPCGPQARARQPPPTRRKRQSQLAQRWHPQRQECARRRRCRASLRRRPATASVLLPSSRLQDSGGREQGEVGHQQVVGHVAQVDHASLKRRKMPAP